MRQVTDSLSAPKRRKVEHIVENPLEISNVILTTLNNAASMAPVPYLQQAAGLALGISNIVQEAKDNRDAFQKFAAYTCELVYDVLRMLEEMEEGDDCGLIEDLLGALSSTKHFLCKVVSRKPAARLLSIKNDLGKIQDHRDRLRRPVDKFLLQSNVAMRKTLLKLERDIGKNDSEAASGSVPAPAAVDKELPPVPPKVTGKTPKPSVTVTQIGGDEVDSHPFSNVTNTDSGNISTVPMFEGATCVAGSGGNFDHVSEDMVINDSSSHTANRGSFNTTNKNSMRDDFSRIMVHNFHAGTVNNYNGAKDVNTGANCGAHPDVVVPAYLIPNLTMDQNDHRGTMPSGEPYALQSHHYQRSRGQGSRPPNYYAHSAPPAEHYYDEQGHYYNGYRRSAYGRPRGARRYQHHARYWCSPQGSHPYQVDSRDEEISSWAMEDAYPDDIYSDEGEEFNPHGAYALSAEGYTPPPHPRSTVAFVTSTAYASLHGGPPPMKSNNPFKEGFCFPITPECS